MKDKCIMCGNDSPYERHVHIDLRVGYIEGAGQLCIACYEHMDDRGNIRPKEGYYESGNHKENIQ